MTHTESGENKEPVKSEKKEETGKPEKIEPTPRPSAGVRLTAAEKTRDSEDDEQ